MSVSHKVLRKKVLENEVDTVFVQKCEDMLDKYMSPKGFIKWNNYVKICMVTGCTEATKRSFLASDVQGVVAGSSYRRAVMNDACARFLSKEIIESFAQTSLPELPPEVANVLPFVHIMLPRETVYDLEGDEVVAIMIESGHLYDKNITEEHKTITQTFFPDKKLAPSEIRGALGLQITTVTTNGMDVFQEFISEEAKSWHESNVKQAVNSKYGNKNTEIILKIAINSLLIHLYEPGIITVDPQTPSKGVGFSAASKQPLPPTWIGKTFKKVTKQELEEKGSQAASSSKSSVRSHWRRGHWHSVCIGPGRLERKVQWFKPIYVNP